MLAETIQVHDHGDTHMPLTLQLDPAIHDGEFVQLTDLFRHWQGELGMSAGLTHAPDLLCVHIDRLLLNAEGHLRKSLIPVKFDLPIDVPILTSDTVPTTERYLPVAAMIHLGHANGGHYQALLKCLTADRDHLLPHWLHCDDLRLPRLCDSVPHGGAEGVTFLWLCKLAALDLHQVPFLPDPSETTAATDCESAILALLSEP